MYCLHMLVYLGNSVFSGYIGKAHLAISVDELTVIATASTWAVELGFSRSRRHKKEEKTRIFSLLLDAGLMPGIVLT